MTKRAAVLLALALLPVSCQPPNLPPPSVAPPDQGRHDVGSPAMSKDDLTLLVGKWSIEKAEFDGEDWSNFTPYRLAKFEIADGGKYTFATVAFGEESSTITVDFCKKPQRNGPERRTTGRLITGCSRRSTSSTAITANDLS